MPARIYFSAFAGQKNTPMEFHPNTPEWRTNRLYQTDYLLRKYGFKADELCSVLDENEFLQNADPKMLLAENLPRIDIKTANYEQLLRIPGIGPVSARNICRFRTEALKGRARKRKRIANPTGTSGNEKKGYPNAVAEDCDWSTVYSMIPAKSLPYIILRDSGIQSRIDEYI